MSIIITKAPSTAAAAQAQTALADNSVFGIAATLSLRSGLWLAVELGAADVPLMLMEMRTRGYEPATYGARMTGAQARDAGGDVFVAYVSGLLDGGA